MQIMKFIAYGVEVNSSIHLPLLIPSVGVFDQSIRLDIMQIDKNNTKAMKYETPTANIHGRVTRLSSNLPLSLSRVLEKRCWKINIEGQFSFNWSNISDSITVEYVSHLDLHKLSFWLLHTIIPIYMMLKQDTLFLHASAVEVKNKALIFIAPSYGGKSTLADFFVQKKYPILSDDKIRLQLKENEYFVFPSYPYRRPYREFEALGLYSEYFTDKPLPINAFYLLSYVEANTNCSIEVVQGLQKFEILKNAYLYEPVSMSKIEMEYLMQLINSNALYQVNIPKDLARLSEVYQVIIEHATKPEVV